jgi:hypothetical protein
MFTTLTIAMTLTGAVPVEVPSIKANLDRPAVVQVAAADEFSSQRRDRRFGQGKISSGERERGRIGNAVQRVRKAFDNGGPGIFGANLAAPPGGNKPFGNGKGSNQQVFGNGTGSNAPAFGNGKGSNVGFGNGVGSNAPAFGNGVGSNNPPPVGYKAGVPAGNAAPQGYATGAPQGYATGAPPKGHGQGYQGNNTGGQVQPDKQEPGQTVPPPGNNGHTGGGNAGGNNNQNLQNQIREPVKG